MQAAAAPAAAAVTSFTFGDDLAASGAPSFVFGAATTAAPQDALMVDAPFSIGTGGRVDAAGRGGSK